MTKIVEIRRTMVITVRRPITYAMIHLCNDWAWKGHKGKRGMRLIWSKPWFKNVSPKGFRQGFGVLKGKTVPTAGRGYLNAMCRVNANWYLISGHHAAMYTYDSGSTKYPGYFNEDYHIGRWISGSLKEPDKRPAGEASSLEGRWKNEVFMRTTFESPPNKEAPFQHFNPLLLAGMLYFRRKVCKGIILGGCNSLGIVPAVRTWAQAYPNSLILGSGWGVDTSAWVAHAIVSAKTPRKKEFWRNPASILSDGDKALAFFKELAAKWPKHQPNERGLVMLFNGHTYVSYLDSASKLQVRYR